MQFKRDLLGRGWPWLELDDDVLQSEEQWVTNNV